MSSLLLMTPALRIALQVFKASQRELRALLLQEQGANPALTFAPAPPSDVDVHVHADTVEVIGPGELRVEHEAAEADRVESAQHWVRAVTVRFEQWTRIYTELVRQKRSGAQISFASLEQALDLSEASLRGCFDRKSVLWEGAAVEPIAWIAETAPEPELPPEEDVAEEPEDYHPDVSFKRPAAISRMLLIRVGEWLLEEGRISAFVPDASNETWSKLAVEAEADERVIFGWLAEDASFDQAGQLSAPMALQTRREWLGQLQQAFAEHGMWLREPALTSSEPLILKPDAAVSRHSHQLIIAQALKSLRAAGFEAHGNWCLTRTEGFDSLSEETGVFWDMQSHEAFDANGMLRSGETLALHWLGDRQLIADVLYRSLAGSGLELEVPADEQTVFSIQPLD